MIPKKNDSFFSNDYESIRKLSSDQEFIGSGTYGQIYIATHKLSKKTHAVKSIQQCIAYNEGLYEQRILNEMKVMDSLSHENLVNFKYTWVEHHSLHCMNIKMTSDFNVNTKAENFGEKVPWLFIAMEHCEKGNLEEWLSKNHSTSPRKLLIQMMLQIVSGLEYTHSKHWMHRDLKPKNIFIDGRDVVKIGDFGSATSILNLEGKSDSHLIPSTSSATSSSQIAMSSDVGTDLYSSPELSKGQYDEKVDVYSLGVIFLEVFLYKLSKDQIEMAKDGVYAEASCKAFPAEVAIIKKMLEKDPKERLTIEKVKSYLIDLVRNVSISDYFPYELSEEKNLDFFCINDESSPILNFMKKDPEKLKLFNSVIRKFTKYLVNNDNSSIFDLIKNEAFTNPAKFNIASTMQKQFNMLNPKKMDKQFVEEEFDLD